MVFKKLYTKVPFSVSGVNFAVRRLILLPVYRGEDHFSPQSSTRTIHGNFLFDPLKVTGFLVAIFYLTLSKSQDFGGIFYLALSEPQDFEPLVVNKDNLTTKDNECSDMLYRLTSSSSSSSSLSETGSSLAFLSAKTKQFKHLTDTAHVSHIF